MSGGRALRRLRIPAMLLIVLFLAWRLLMPCFDRSKLNFCGSAVKLQATTTTGAPGACRIHESTFVSSVFSIVSLPKLAAFTFAGVRIRSCRFAPVRARSL